jgi:hypothetical protein
VDRIRKEIAAAELEARRLSLARRPSAPNIPRPGEFKMLTTTQSVGGKAPESPPSSGGSYGQRMRSKSNANKRSPELPNGSDSSSSSRGRSGSIGLPATPKAMRHPKYSDGYIDAEAPAVPGIPLTLPNTVYQAEAAKIGRSMSVPVIDFQKPAAPVDIPHHPRYIPNLPRSRSTSRSRGPRGHNRNGSRELGSVPYGAPASVSISIENEIGDKAKVPPPIIPELQHLNTPPPPPPIPGVAGARLKEAGSITTVMDNARAGYEISRPVTTGTDSRHTRRMSADHRRGGSINESFATKLRNFTGRMRSSSRGPGVQSPPTESSENTTVSPYESVRMPMENGF